jgi:hypothetical protein
VTLKEPIPAGIAVVYCRFGDIHVRAARASKAFVQCVAPPQEAGFVRFGLSYDEKEWSKEETKLRFVPAPGFLGFVADHVVIILGTLAVIGALVAWCVLRGGGEKEADLAVPTSITQDEVDEPDEREPFLSKKRALID